MNVRSGRISRPGKRGRARALHGLLGAVAVVAALAVAGCGADDSDSGSSAERPAVGLADRQPAEAPAGAAEVAPNQPAQDPATELGVGQRALVYTGSVTVRVDDVDAAAASAVGIVTGAGGFVGGDNRSTSGSTAEATLKLRIPADRFGTVVEEVTRLGRPLRREVSTDDVTEETLDLDARIATQQARVASGRRLLAQAESLSDLVLLEGELAKREADLASLEAKKRRLADLTALSTVTVVLLGPNAREPDDDEPSTGFLAGLKGGWEAFVVSLRVLLTVLGALLPWVVALGLPVAGVLWVVRRLRRRRTPPTPPPPARPTVPAQVPASKS